MEEVRSVVDSSLLDGIIHLPAYLQKKQVGIVVFSIEEKKDALPSFSMAEIDEMMKGSVTESLIGSIPNRDISLEEYRAERLKKYESVD
jgi:hypothetical protein